MAKGPDGKELAFAFKCHRPGKDIFPVNTIKYHPSTDTRIQHILVGACGVVAGQVWAGEPGMATCTLCCGNSWLSWFCLPCSILCTLGSRLHSLWWLHSVL